MARILVADDDAVTCQLMSEVLSRDGSTVIGETDPRRALARAAEEHIDLAIVDVQMPDLDGLALLRTLQQRHVGTHASCQCVARRRAAAAACRGARTCLAGRGFCRALARHGV